MSTISLAYGRPTLADRVIPRSLVTDMLLVVTGVLFTAAAAQVVIPIWPVPITGQTLAVLLVGSALGAVRGAVSLAALAAPSFGYIVGFILSAALVGWIAERAGDRKVLGAALSFLGGTVATFAIGLPWLAITLGLGLESTLQFGLYPFIVGGVIKAAIAAVVIPGVWAIIARRDRGNTA